VEGGLRTLVSSDYVVVVLNDYSLETLFKVFKYLSTFSEATDILVNLRTSVVVVLINDVRRYLTIPPLTFFIRYDDSYEVMSRLLSLSLDISVYKLSDHAWVECKRFPSNLVVLADKPILDVLSDLGLSVKVVNTLNDVLERGGAVLISCSECLEPTVLINSLFKLRMIADLRSLKGVDKVLVRGFLKTYFKDHILTYGIESEEFQGFISNHYILNKLLVYGRPLIYLNSNVLALELPNKSLIFTTDLIFSKGLLLRSLLYVF
jgi:hypothetical protein